MLEAFRQIHRFTLTFADVDMLQHANNVAYARWAETQRTDYFAEILGERIGGERGMILARSELVYEKPLTYRERVAIGGRVAAIGTKSFTFLHEVWSEDRDVRCATISCTLVAFDYVTNSTIAVPGGWRAKIHAFEQMPAPASS